MVTRLGVRVRNSIIRGEYESERSVSCRRSQRVGVHCSRTLRHSDPEENVMPGPEGPESPIRARHGEWVEVRSLAEIRATLDAHDALEGLPFQREMAGYCGRRLRIFRRADRVCAEGDRLRRLKNTVLLEDARCDGSAHDGCQRDCLMLWKTAWLKPAPGPAAGVPMPATRGWDDATLAPMRYGRYYCQSTEIQRATTAISKWDLTDLARDLLNGEASVARTVRVLWSTARRKLPRGLGRPPRGRGSTSPTGELGLRPGEWVEVKSREEIEATLTADGRNRGLTFEMEMLVHCGKHYQVDCPITRIISERTGEMLHLNGTVALTGVTCQGTCSRNCPRANPLYWREIWLRRP
jgi:hypothetical protein